LRRKLIGALVLVGFTVLLAACTGSGPQDTWDPAGQPAQDQKNLIVPIFWIAGAVFVLVEGGFLVISIRHRHRKGRERTPKQTHGNTRLEVGWTIAPAVVLAVIMVPTVAMIWELDRPDPDALQVTVQGYQWWWGFEYTDEDMRTSYGDQGPIIVADTLVVPVDQAVQLTLTTAGGGARDNQGVPDHEVIHSFWTPRLFGKQDAVPEHEGTIVFTAAETGTYWGQCAEFCGLQHGRMKFRVVVLDAAAWEDWVTRHKLPAETPADPLAAEGMDLFFNADFIEGSCIDCHAIGGTDAVQTAAPNLTHFADPTHECFAGCNWETSDVEALKAWLRDPDAVKQGAKMPDYGLTEDEIDAIVAYLYSLT
jgi:cytochrome c oxidase subunit 2